MTKVKTTELAVIQPEILEHSKSIEEVKKEKIDFLKSYSTFIKSNLLTKIEDDNILSLISSILIERYYLPLEDIEEYQKLLNFLGETKETSGIASSMVGILSTMRSFLTITPEEHTVEKVKKIDSYRSYL